MVVPRQRGGPASPRGLQHRAAFAAPRGPPVPRSLWGLSASARPCWGSELLGAGRGRCGLAGQSTATQEPQSAIQRGEPGPPPCGAATRDCCGVRAEAPRDGPPPAPQDGPALTCAPPTGDELHQRRAEHGRPDGGALKRAHHRPHRSGGDRRYKVRTPPAPHRAPPPPQPPYGDSAAVLGATVMGSPRRAHAVPAGLWGSAGWGSRGSQAVRPEPRGAAAPLTLRH